MIGIIGAMDIEVENLIQKLCEKSTNVYSGITYTTGKYNKTDVVVAKCGMGKVNAAMCTQTMLLMYSPKAVINIGVAGALSQNVKVGDIVIGTAAVQHDFDLSPIGFDRGFIAELNNKFVSCTEEITEKLELAAQKTKSTYHMGIIATGDCFINSGITKDALFNEFNAIACEMEGASIAHICALNNTNFGIVRTISDNANDDSAFDFDNFVREAAQKSIALILEFFCCCESRT